MAKMDQKARLSKTIRILELKQERSLILLKGQIKITRDRFGIINIFKATLANIDVRPGLKTDLAISVIRLLAGYFSERQKAAASPDPIRKLPENPLLTDARKSPTGIISDLCSVVSILAHAVSSRRRNKL
jgi:hypothetical protein